MERLTLYKAQLLDMLAEGKSLYSLCDFVEDNIGSPTAICLATETIIATSRSYTHDLVREYVDSPKKYDTNDMVNSQKMLELVYSDCKPHVIYFPYLHDKRVLCGCIYKKERIAILDIVLQKEDPTEEQLDFVELVATHLPLFMKSNGFLTNERKNISVQNLVVGIINGTVSVEKQRIHIYNSRFFGTKNWRLLLIAKRTEEKEESQEASDTLFDKLYKAFASEYGWWPVLYMEDTYERSLVLVDDTRMEDVSKLMNFCAKNNCVANISYSFSNLECLPEAFDNLKLMDITFLNATIDETLRFYDDYKIGLAITNLYIQGRKDIFKSRYLEQIIEYDNMHGTEYYITLEMYFAHRANNKEIANALFIHNNTVMYRLRRISKLFSIDFGNYRIMSDIFYSLTLGKLAQRAYDNHGNTEKMGAGRSDEHTRPN